jgi:hypothetical protein
VPDPKAALALQLAEAHRERGVTDVDELARFVVADLLDDDLVSRAEAPEWRRKVAADLRRAGG